MRSDYGETLRRFLHRHARPVVIVDFGHSPVFPAADTFPCLPVMVRRDGVLAPTEYAPDEQTFSVCLLPRDDYSPDMNLGRYVAEHRHEVPVALLKDELWLLEGPRVHRLLERLRSTGVLLKEFCESAPLYGVKSGLNEAFYIDDQTRAQLIAADPRSAELIKPLLRGRDIDRWRPAAGDSHILFVRRGTDIDAYPAVKRHLARYRPALEKRAGPQAWHELQASPSDAFVEVMFRPKLVYQEIQYHSWFALDTAGACINNKVFMLPTDDLALLGVLCSPVMWWLFTRTLPHMKDEALCPAGFIMENLRVSTGTPAQAEQMRKLVGSLIELTRERHVWDAQFAGEACAAAGVDGADARTIDWLAEPPPVFVRRLAALSEGGRKPADLLPAIIRSYERGRARRIDLLTRQLELEQALATGVEDVYGLSAEERALLRETRPVRDPLDVLGAKLGKLTGAGAG